MLINLIIKFKVLVDSPLSRVEKPHAFQNTIHVQQIEDDTGTSWSCCPGDLYNSL